MYEYQNTKCKFANCDDSIQAYCRKTDILVDMYNRNKPGHITYLYIYRNS